MPKIAKVAVNGVTYGIDHTYDYLLPDSMVELKPGTRIVVPFGNGNRRREAILLAKAEYSEHSALKTVIEALDSEPVLTQEQISLALWMRERCFCTFYETVRAMLPTGALYSIEPCYRFADGMDRESAEQLTVNDDEKRIISLIGDGIKQSVLEREPGISGLERRLKNLCDRGILVKESFAVRGIGDKTIQMVRLAITEEEAEDYIIKNQRRAPASSAVVEFLLSAGEVAMGEITYYTGSKQQVINSLRKKGIVETEKREVYRRPGIGFTEYRKTELNGEQRQAYDRLCELADDSEAKAALLFGVTGSGKTQVYMSLIEHVLREGKSAMVLVPEIALTPQLMRIFYARFGERVAILHSALSVGQRYDEWKRIKNGDADIVLGTRSAIFAPLKDIGVIVIDEEQEYTYKSENSPRYHARDVAKYRVAKARALLLLGSATPSVESFFWASAGKYELLELKERYNRHELPAVMIADMREELKNANSYQISRVLQRELEKNINSGEQSILFINRRGNSRQLICGECGYVPQCPNCSVSLTYHSANDRMMCHYCGTSYRAESICPECGGEFKFVGAGTQKCEDELRLLFPGVEIMRMDSDTTAPRHSHDEMLTRFREEKIPILIGTQMVAKGLDFENVTLVGVLSADQALYSEDFRAHERTFSLVTQVIGRAGRGEKPGRAVLQTYTPFNPTLEAAVKQDYRTFYEDEIGIRRQLGYPPFNNMIALTVTGGNDNGTMRAAFEAREILRAIVEANRLKVKIVGPLQAYVLKVNGLFRYRLMLICKDERAVLRAVTGTIKQFNANKLLKQYSIYADMNPNEF